MIYAGIGSRKTPTDILKTMYLIGYSLSRSSVLRSGHAIGADMAFEAGCRDANGLMQIFTAPDSSKHPRWFDHAKKYHLAWGLCSDHAKRLHARNSAIMLGENLDKPVDAVVCWTPGSKVIGGTGQALRIAEDCKIKVFNLFDNPSGNDFFIHLSNMKPKL